jgi:CrcB protein
VSLPLWIAFLTAAAAGAAARYLLDGIVTERTGATFPWGTCVINVSGSFALGVIVGLGLYHGLSTDARVVAGTGFCGAYTTFSTFTYETLQLVEGAARRPALRNIVVNTVGGLAAAGLGLAVAAV